MKLSLKVYALNAIAWPMKAKHPVGDERMAEKDHEFPWIEREEMTLTCTRCGKSDGIDEWIGFVTEHSHCKPKRGTNE